MKDINKKERKDTNMKLDTKTSPTPPVAEWDREQIKDVLYNFLQDYTSTKDSDKRDQHIEKAVDELEKIIK